MRKLKAFWQQQKHNPLHLIIFFTVVYLIAIFAYIFRKEDKYVSNWDPIYSTYYHDETGLSTFFELLKKNQIPAKRSQSPFRFLDTQQTYNLWLNPPSEAYRLNELDYAHLTKIIAKGSNLVCIVNRNKQVWRELLKQFRIYQKKEDKYEYADTSHHYVNPEKMEVINPVVWFGHVDSLSFKEVLHKREDGTMLEELWTDKNVFYYFYSDTFAIIPYLRMQGTRHAQVAMMHYGKGRIFLCSMPDPLTNEGISRKSNASFWLNLAKNLYKSNRQPILFDEYSHGFGNDFLDLETHWSPFMIPQAKYVLWGLTLLFILYVRSQGKRLIKPVKIYEEPRRRVMEFVEAVAKLYEKNKAHNAVLNQVTQRFRKHLINHLGISQNSHNDEVIHAYQRRYGSVDSQKLSLLIQKIEQYKNKATLNQTAEIIQEIRQFCLLHKIEYYKI
ncbi:MAG: hypothetical protein NZ455_06660 [Bacteroidia bacterium]|nr:hypothetical protein [Bacteroidia bacterium]MDW8345717.1 DUF4350 domain-containing protein [Bacteroidia bacterium]